MSGPILELAGVDKDFGEEVITRVLHAIDLRIEQGELTALVGPSGSGKSTLLNLLGLLDRPTRGTVRVLGRDIRELEDDQLTQLRGRTLGFIFQFHHLLPAFTALENVALPMAAIRGRLEPDMLEVSERMLRDVGLGDRLGHRPSQLSGGQQQRVAIARALALRPSLVLADEPTGNLDTHTAAEVFALMQRFHRELGTSFLIVTHDQRLAAQCSRRISIVDGRIVSDEKQ